MVGFVDLSQQILHQWFVVIPVNRFGFQCFLFRFGQLAKIEVADRTEKIGVGVIDRIQFECTAG